MGWNALDEFIKMSIYGGTAPPDLYSPKAQMTLIDCRSIIHTLILSPSCTRYLGSENPDATNLPPDTLLSTAISAEFIILPLDKLSTVMKITTPCLIRSIPWILNFIFIVGGDGCNLPSCTKSPFVGPTATEKGFEPNNKFKSNNEDNNSINKRAKAVLLY
jgi:hypothetical protein